MRGIDNGEGFGEVRCIVCRKGVNGRDRASLAA